MKETKELAREVEEEIREEKRLFTKSLIKEAMIEATLAWERYCKLQQRREELLIMTVDQICKEAHFHSFHNDPTVEELYTKRR